MDSSARLRCVLRLLLVLIFAGISLSATDAGQTAAQQFPGLKWRLIGPFRAGRVTAVAGAPDDPNTYYFATPGGGVWKTTNAGQVWSPIFDKERVASIGALAVAPSDARIVYVGTGEQTRGNGIYRSSDAGMIWNNVGLNDVLFIQSIVVDPRNPNIVIVAGNSLGMGLLWQPLPRWAKTANRGIFKTSDGGKTWAKVFNDDSTVGVVDMCSDLSDARTLYAAVYRPASETKDGKTEATSYIVRSTDEGTTWEPLKSTGLPEKARKRLGIAVAAGTGGRRLYAIMDQGFFRSDDGGATWTQSTKDARIKGSAYFSRIFTDPNHPDVLYVAQTSLYRSTDGGKTFEAYVGAPSGDDFHVLWIDPRNSNRMILGVDQGAIISVDRGKTWSSWYNQPTGQFYHVSTDNSFPYRVYGAQQDSGTASVLSRSDYGEVLLQDWNSVGGFEYAFITPDPAHPNIVYSGGWYGSVVRWDRSTGQIATLFEHGKKYRMAQMPPLVFSPQNSSVLYLGTQMVLKTADAGITWNEISPDLTGYKEEEPGAEERPGRLRPPAITAIAPSFKDAAQMWVGTSNRLVYLTRDSGGSWANVTPPDMAEPMQVLYVEASHLDPATAYVTAGGTRESTPAFVVRTHDYGKSWQKIVNGIPANEMVRVMREDPKRRGLLYAGTDTSVYVSWDDGDHWQPLSLNLPASPVTDIQVHENDLAISTFGRSLWILDNVSPLRELNADSNAGGHLFAPATALRVRWENYQDTPYPIETPAGQNPPDGAMIDYFLKSPPTNPLTLTVFDDKGNEVASYSSEATPVSQRLANVPDYWFIPPATLSKDVGVNRFVWNLRYPSPATLPFSYGGELLEYTEYTLADHTVPGETPREQPQGPFIVPGRYTVELKYNGQTSRQSLTVELDPRVHASLEDLVDQRDLALRVSRGMKASYDSYLQVEALHKALTGSQAADPKAKDAAEKLEKQIEALEKGTTSSPGFGLVNRDLGRLIFGLESADMRPSQSMRQAIQETCDALDKDLLAWKQLNEQNVAQFNQTFGNNTHGLALTVTGCNPRRVEAPVRACCGSGRRSRGN